MAMVILGFVDDTLRSTLSAPLPIPSPTLPQLKTPLPPLELPLPPLELPLPPLELPLPQELPLSPSLKS